MEYFHFASGKLYAGAFPKTAGTIQIRLKVIQLKFDRRNHRENKCVSSRRDYSHCVRFELRFSLLLTNADGGFDFHVVYSAIKW